jgi:hypothetical protein
MLLSGLPLDFEYEHLLLQAQSAEVIIRQACRESKNLDSELSNIKQ